MKHYSVMKKEVIDFLNLKEDSVIVDATLGYAGVSKEILKIIKKGYLYAFDSDMDAINYSNDSLKKVGSNYKLFHSNFVNMKNQLEKEGKTQVDGIIFDLGVSSPQIDTDTRGFSFMRDADLDMRMDKSQNFNAKDLINNYSEEELTNIFYKYGEENTSKKIAHKIIERRKTKEITKTLELVDIIKSAVGSNYFYKHHPERKIFQAIRIEVNKELEVLETVLPDAISLLKKGGRLVIITFHSLEDKIVKNTFKKYSEVLDVFKGLPDIPDKYLPQIKIITKKAVIAEYEELIENSRSKSAKLRVIEKVI